MYVVRGTKVSQISKRSDREDALEIHMLAEGRGSVLRGTDDQD